MAFIPDNFGPVGGMHGPDNGAGTSGIAMFSYITADALSVVVDDGYFNALRNKIFKGDTIFVGSTQLDADSSDNEYSVIYVDVGAISPSTEDITINSKDINAAAS